MALNYKKNTTEKFDVKGVLDATAQTVTYLEKKDGNEVETTITIQDYLDKFASQYVQITIQTKSEVDLELENTEE